MPGAVRVGLRVDVPGKGGKARLVGFDGLVVLAVEEKCFGGFGELRAVLGKEKATGAKDADDVFAVVADGEACVATSGEVASVSVSSKMAASIVSRSSQVTSKGWPSASVARVISAVAFSMRASTSTDVPRRSMVKVRTRFMAPGV